MIIYKLKSSDNAELNPKYSDSLKTLSVFSFYTFLGAPIRYIQKLQLLQSCTLNIWNFLWVYPVPFLSPMIFQFILLAQVTECLLASFIMRAWTLFNYLRNIFQIYFFFLQYFDCFFFFPLYLMDEKMDFSIKITLENFVNIALARTSILCENMICQSFQFGKSVLKQRMFPPFFMGFVLLLPSICRVLLFLSTEKILFVQD